MTMTDTAPNAARDQDVHQSITVRASVDKAFRIFTAEFDSWWPRSHHIGSTPMTKAVIEPGVGGRCYASQEDGSDCPWGTILVWEPPTRFAFAWQITPEWKYEPDLAKASEVEVRFTAVGDKATRVDLVHRHFHKHGAGGDTMRAGVAAEGGWKTLLDIYAAKVAE